MEYLYLHKIFAFIGKFAIVEICLNYDLSLQHKIWINWNKMVLCSWILSYLLVFFFIFWLFIFFWTVIVFNFSFSGLSRFNSCFSWLGSKRYFVTYLEQDNFMYCRFSVNYQCIIFLLSLISVSCKPLWIHIY